MQKDPLNTLKQSLDQLLQTDTSIKRKNKKEFEQKRDLFINIINQFEHSITKSFLIEKDYKKIFLNTKKIFIKL